MDAKIVDQLVFYFGDANLPCDTYLRNQINADDEGWVRINILLRFNRLRSMSKDPAVISAAVRNAPQDTLVEVNDDNDSIRRKPERSMPAADQKTLKDLVNRTVYCTGFPKTSTQDDLLDFADSLKPEFSVIKVFPGRTTISKEFKGQAFITFETKEQADTFRTKDSVMYNNTINLGRMRRTLFT